MQILDWEQGKRRKQKRTGPRERLEDEAEPLGVQGSHGDMVGPQLA